MNLFRATRVRPMIEQMEPRILYSADLNPALASNPALMPQFEQRVVDASGEFTYFAAANAELTRQEVVFVDTATPDYQVLVDGIHNNEESSNNFDVVLLDSDTDGISQISEYLAARQDVSAIHIVSHGSDAAFQLGQNVLDAQSLQQNAEQISLWGNALTADADLMIYGCDVAQSDAGRALIDSLAHLTGADVAASTDLTGHAARGGDWELEYARGEVETAIAFGADVQQNWFGILPTAAITARETVDSDGNGQIDHIKMTAEGALNDDFSDINITVGSYTLAATPYVTNIGAGGALDDVFYVALVESGSADTGATPAVTVTANTNLKVGANEIATDEADAWWNAQWLSRTKITFDNTASAENLTDFPVLVSLTASDVDFAKIKAGGDDIRFIDDDGTVLDYEIEAWDDTPGSESATVWVRVQQINANVSTDYIHMYYNNTGASDAQNAAAVWDASHVGVWHLGESGDGTADEFVDSSGTGNHGQGGGGTAGETPTQTTAGQIGNAQIFDASDDHVTIANAASLGITGDITISAWVKLVDPTGDWGTVLAKYDGKAEWDYEFFVQDGKSAASLEFYSDNTSPKDLASDDDVLADSLWHHVSMTRNGSDFSFYVDGVDAGTATATGAFGNNSFPVTLGYTGENKSGLDASMDEVRLSNTARSADWIEASFLSQNGTFNTFGDVQAGTIDKAAPVLLSMETADLDSDGTIDALHLTYSEAVSDASVQASDFTVTIPAVTGLAFNPTANGDTANDADIYLTFDDGVHDTGVTPTLAYTQSGGTDLEDLAAAPNKSVNLAGSVTTDKAGPVIIANETADLDSDGFIDAIHVTFSEAIQDATVGGANWDVAGVAGETFSGTTNGDTVDDADIYISFADGVLNTGATPTLGYDLNVVADAAGNLHQSADAWWNGDWLNRKSIAFDNTASAENLTDFPVLVSLTAADVDFSKIKAGGADIRFVDNDGTVLNYEIEAWDDGAETASVWVKVQQIDANVNTDFIHLYYNNTNANDAQNAAGVWDANYQGVWHLQEQVTDEQTVGTHVDSTGVNDGTQNNNAPVAGRIDGGQDFDQNADYINIDSVADDIDVTKGSMSAWMKMDAMAERGYLVSVFTDADNQVDMRWDDAGGNFKFRLEAGANTTVRSDPVISDTDGLEHLVTMTWDTTADEMKVYTDGVQIGTTQTGLGTWAGAISRVYIGASADDGQKEFDGMIDEVRISSTARSADWIEASYLSQNGTFAFSTIGHERVVTTDKAAPVLLSASSAQSIGSNLFEVQGQILDLVFSETLSAAPTEANLEAALQFAAGATDGDNLPTIGTGANPISLVTTTLTDDTVRVTYNTNNAVNADALLVGTHTAQVISGVNITDTAANTADTGTAAVTINGDVNDAPVLDNSGAPTFTTITEDDTANGGDLVSAIVGTTITDPDAYPVEGIAVTALNSSNGTWQYNTGSGWTDVGGVGDATALLLRSTDSLRFVPDTLTADSASVTYRAWDRTSGGAGAKVNVGAGGGTSAFSSAADTATITVTGVNDTPVGLPTITGTVTEDQILTADTSGISDADGVGAFSYQWLRGGAAIGGATASTYTLGDADVGTLISVEVSYTDGESTAEGPLTSVQTAAVTNVNDTPVGVPTITGTVTEDQLLTADTSGISDADGLGAFSYQWLRGGAAIGGATASTYTLGDADVGTLISVEVSYTDGNTTAEGPLTSVQTAAVTNVNDTPVGVPTITGTVTEDQLLTADTSGISDADGLGAFSYQWLRGGAAIGGATASTYTLGDADVGTLISVEVSYTDGNTTAEGPLTSVQTAAVTNVNDTPVGVPTITGTVTEDQLLTADTSGISDADGLGAFSYQWLRGGAAIGGATASTYTLGDADVGTLISVEVSYTDGNTTAEGPLTSVQTAAVANVNDTPVGVPTITGTVTEDQLLTADTSGISDADGLGAFSYQWLRGGAAIGGATASTYTLGDADVGTLISVEVSYTDGNTTAEGPLTSVQTAAVTNVNDTPVGVPTITGTVTEDQLLTADTSGISDADGLGAFSYQWLRGGAAIGGATASTYTLGDADVGTLISVEVSYTDGNTTAEGPLTSVQTAAVTNVNDTPVGVPTITGTVTEDQLLTADTSGISDADGLGAFSYQWLRGGAAIGGATASTYTLGDADVGTLISVEVSYTDGNTTAEGPLTSVQTAAVTNVNDTPVGVPTITGTVTEDQLLTADTSGISDADGLGAFSYQWLRGGAAIGGATASTYMLGDADVGTLISVEVSYTDGESTAEGPLTSVQTATVANVNDTPVGVPTITGTVTEDQLLTADTSGISDADGLGAFSYQWLRGGAAIGGATASTYTLGDADVGTLISVEVSYTDGNTTAEGPLTSVQTAAVANVNDTPVGVPTITGTVTEDQLLTADTSGISDADGLGAFSYQWLRGGAAIGGATASTYTLGDADVGTLISVEVSYTDGNTTAEGPLTSVQTAAVTNVNDTPVGVPTITGTVTEDQLLTADTSGISDADGLGAFSYQWLRGGAAIGGATASTYTLGDADVGTLISVEVSYTDGNTTAEGPLTSVQTAAVANVNDTPVGVPTITGTVTEDQLLTADTSGISDADGLGAFSYQWLRGGAAIGGATASTYTLGDADVGTLISVEVSYTDGNTTAEGPLTSVQTAAVTNVNDAPVGVPTITGTVTEDQLLTADTSSISDADGLGAFSYQWLRGGAAIGGATASTYTLGDADVGALISVEVSYTDGNTTAEGPLTSVQTTAVANVNDAPVGVPAITGTVTEDQLLTADTSGISDADGLGAFSYQWLRGGAAIGGATASTYTLGDADVGTLISVEVSYTDGNTTAEGPLTSVQTAAVANVNDTPVGVPTITGTVTEDQLLTADTSGISDADGLGAFSYQWLRGGAAIGGATASTYTLGDADVGTLISVEVSYTDGNTTAEGPLTSVQTGAVANVNDTPVGVPTITGTVTEDQLLTADTSGISDVDGLGAFSYQWLRGGAAIGGATASTYTLGDADVGTLISVEVSYTDGNTTAEGPLTSVQTAAVTNVNDTPVGVPTITGTVTEDQLLTADTSGVSDADGLGAFSYQWLRGGAAIGGATASTYTLGDADVGTLISVEVSYTDGNTTAEGPLTSVQTAAVANVNDIPVGVPTITGTVTEDQLLTVDTSGISDADGLGAFSYQWLRGGAAIGGATASTYTLGDADVGTLISVEVSYTDGNTTAEGPLTSVQTAAVANVNDAPVGVPTITGTVTEDQLLTADTSGISDADGLGAFSYQWLRGGAAIGGATASTYTLGDADVGTLISVEVSYTDGNTTAEGPLTSVQTAAVANVNDTPVGVPTITGTVTEDQLLTADISGISDADGLGAFSYQWLRGGAAIGGATASTYTLGDADVGTLISVEVSYTDGNTTAEGPLTSVQTAAVANVNDTPVGVPTITGTVTEDQLLTADTSGISDVDGLGAFSYQWLRGGAAIGGATASTYTLGDADVGTLISVEVSYTDGNTTAEGPLTSVQTAAVANVNDTPVGVPTITGTVSEDQLLTADTSGISDADGVGAFSYQWLRGGAAIGGATASTYTLGDADVGTLISVEVSYTDGESTAEGPLTSLQTAAVANVNDTPVGVPTITGTVTEDQLLTADTSGISDADGLGAFSYQWLRGGAAIGGATASTYTLGDADVGTLISVEVSYTDGNATAEGPLTSVQTAAVANVNDTPVGVPTITGTVTEDQLLTADTSGISDADGLGAFSYQWLRGGAAIGGATASTYTLGDADVGTLISVEVSYTDGNTTAEGPLTSVQTGAVANVNDTPVGVPTITGTVTEDQLLTADTSGISDADGLGAFSYQWLRGGAAIGGATASTYTLGNADVGTLISVEVSYTDGNTTAEGPLTSVQTAAVANVNDTPVGVPTITGTVTEDQLLTADTSGISDADGLGAFSYQWLRGGAAIGGATASTYTLGDADVGTLISVEVSYTDGNTTAEGPLTSAQTVAVTNINDAPTGTVSISGIANEAQVLTAGNTLADADGLGAISYQWQRNAVDIAGATASTYTLIGADVGTTISVVASYTDAQATAESVSSAGVGPITNVNNLPTGVPTVVGTVQEDQILTADTSGISDADGLGAFSYQWLRGGVAIGGATASTYTLGDADVGSQISVQVSFTDGDSTAEGPLTSVQTAAVSNVNDAPVGLPTITGTVTEDQILTADTSGISDADGLGAFSYQWLRGGAAIGGASASTYTLGDADVGTQISVRANYTDGQGTSESPTSTTVGPVVNINDAPIGSANTVTTLRDTAFVFSAGDFGFSDPNDNPANSLLAVRIAALPTAGTLTENGVPVVAGQFVNVADINAGWLVFTPTNGANGAAYATFTFQVQDDGAGSDMDLIARAITVNVNVDAPRIGIVPPPVIAPPPVVTPPPVASDTDPQDTPADEDPGKQPEETMLAVQGGSSSAPGLQSQRVSEVLQNESISRTHPVLVPDLQQTSTKSDGPIKADGWEEFLASLNSSPNTTQQPGEEISAMLDNYDFGEIADEQFFTLESGLQLSGMALSAGFVSWAIRGAGLFASLLTSLPAWRHMDPLPVLKEDEKEKEKNSTLREDDDDHDIDDEGAVGDLWTPGGAALEWSDTTAAAVLSSSGQDASNAGADLTMTFLERVAPRSDASEPARPAEELEGFA